MTQRQLHHQNPPPGLVTAHKAGSLEQAAQLAGGSTGDLRGLNLFQSLLCSSASFHLRGTLTFIDLWQGRSLVNLIILRSFVAFLPEGLPFRPNEGWNGSVFQYWRKLEKMVPIYQGSIPKRINKISPLSIVSIEKDTSLLQLQSYQ